MTLGQVTGSGWGRLHFLLGEEGWGTVPYTETVQGCQEAKLQPAQASSGQGSPPHCLCGFQGTASTKVCFCRRLLPIGDIDCFRWVSQMLTSRPEWRLCFTVRLGEALDYQLPVLAPVTKLSSRGGLSCVFKVKFVT